MIASVASRGVPVRRFSTVEKPALLTSGPSAQTATELAPIDTVSRTPDTLMKITLDVLAVEKRLCRPPRANNT